MTLSGIARDPYWELLRVDGPAAASFLQRMLTNSVEDLDEARAAGAFLLEPTGRIVSGGTAVRDGDGFLFLCAPGWRRALMDGLDKYIIAEPVELHEDPRVAHLWLDPPPEKLPSTLYGTVRDGNGIGVRVPWTGLDEVVWIGDAPDAPILEDAAEVEAERIVAGTPRFGAELTDKTIPLEAGMYDWLEFNKGCFVGQEVVERMWSRGRMARHVTGFVAADGPIEAETPRAVHGEGTKGTITSIGHHPELGTVGLGFLSGQPPERVEEEAGAWNVRPLPMVSGRMVPERVQT